MSRAGSSPPRLRIGWREPSGFTLIEIVVVLGIVAISLTLAPTLFSGALSTVSLKREARELGSALRHLRSVAIASQAPQALTVDVEARSYAAGDSSGVVSLPNATRVEIVTAESEMLNDHIGSIRFFPDGGATGGQIILERGSRRIVVDIDWVTGRVKLYEDAAET